jgi:hypothetical protein
MYNTGATLRIQQSKETLSMRSSHSSFMLVALALLPCAAHAQSPTPTPTDPASQYGWLEGTITNSQGQAISKKFLVSGQEIKGTRQGGGEFDTQTNLDMGGLYSAKNIRPGVYDITLEKGWTGYQTGPQTPYCPERIFGVVVKPGERSILKIVMDQGDTYEEVGKPAVVSAPATNVTEELARMQKQIDDLKQQVATLLKATAAPATAAKP